MRVTELLAPNTNVPSETLEQAYWHARETKCTIEVTAQGFVVRKGTRQETVSYEAALSLSAWEAAIKRIGECEPGEFEHYLTGA